MPSKSPHERTRLIAYIGSYRKGGNPDGGGIFAYQVSADGSSMTLLSRTATPSDAGYLVYAPGMQKLYALDERRTDGRGPVCPPSQVHSFTVTSDGGLAWLNAHVAPGANPSHASIHEQKRILITANHGGFDHVEQVFQTAAGEWTTRFLYDDSTVVMYDLDEDGRVNGIRDVWVLTGHGKDPNSSAQADGHAQASPHAHCAAIDPSGRYVVVCDKGTDQILVFEFDAGLQVSQRYAFPPETAPRHIAFDETSDRAFVTCELSSELASFSYDLATGRLRLLCKVSTVAPGFRARNEPAEVRLHPNGRFVYVNNRGEDTLAWFTVGPDGGLRRSGQVNVAKSVHPGLAPRSFTFAPSGRFLLFADRPTSLIRSFAVSGDDGSLRAIAEVPMPDPASIVFAEL